MERERGRERERNRERESKNITDIQLKDSRHNISEYKSILERSFKLTEIM